MGRPSGGSRPLDDEQSEAAECIRAKRDFSRLSALRLLKRDYPPTCRCKGGFYTVAPMGTACCRSRRMSADVLPADQDEIYAEQAPAPGQKRCLNERESFVLRQFLTLSIQWHHIQASIWDWRDNASRVVSPSPHRLPPLLCSPKMPAQPHASAPSSPSSPLSPSPTSPATPMIEHASAAAEGKAAQAHTQAAVEASFAQAAAGSETIDRDQLRELCVALHIVYSDSKHLKLAAILDPAAANAISCQGFYSWLYKRDRKKGLS